ncbi:MAG TPA: Gfo/Idh/MocA family oxidoreductase [Anaerolineaceae bacterium]
MMTQSDKPLRHLIIGAGAIVIGAHRPAWDLETTRIAALCDLDPERARVRVEEMGVPFYRDYRQMLAEVPADVAVVTTPHYLHAQIAIDALQAGCHVLVEKPMALSVVEADRMIAVSQAAGKMLAVNFQHRHRPEVRAARQLIQQGRLGKIQRVTMVIPWPRSARYYRLATWRGTWRGEGGGILMNQAPHDLDLICHLLGSPSRVLAWTRTRFHQMETEDTASAMLEWPDGAIGHLHVSTAEGEKGYTIEIAGTGGVLQITMGGLSFNEFELDVQDYLAKTDELFKGPDSRDVTIPLEEGSGDHTAVYRDFHSAILHGTPIAADGAQGRMGLELANAIIYSSFNHREVELPLNREAYGALLSKLQASGRAI